MEKNMEEIRIQAFIDAVQVRADVVNYEKVIQVKIKPEDIARQVAKQLRVDFDEMEIFIDDKVFNVVPKYTEQTIRTFERMELVK